MAKLVIFRGDAVENEIHLEGSTVRIGRHERNDVVIDDSSNSVSRYHAEIRAEGGTYFIVDLNSRNGVWISGRRIKEKAALALGVPATVGGFELVLEDDATSGEFDVNQRTAVVNAASVDPREAPGRSASGSPPTRPPLAANTRQVLLWSGAVAALLLICAVTFVVVRYKTRPDPLVAVVDPPRVIQETPPLEPPPVEDPKKILIAQNLTDARAQMAAGDFSGALRDHLRTVLELEPENTEALELKRQADGAIAAAAQKAPRPPARPESPKPEASPSEVETPGIQRRPNEAYEDYAARVRRIQVALSEGKSSLDKKEFAAAIAHFRSVERDQPKYQGVDLLITEALGQQQRAFEAAMNAGQQNEEAGKVRDARRWYQDALRIDPSSTHAREKDQSLLSRMTADASKLYDRATLAVKLQDPEAAIRLFQQIVDLMLPGDEIRQQSVKQLEALKR